MHVLEPLRIRMAGGYCSIMVASAVDTNQMQLAEVELPVRRSGFGKRLTGSENYWTETLLFVFGSCDGLQFLVARGPCLSTHCPQTTNQAQEVCVGRESMVLLGCVEDDSSGGCTSSLFDVLSCAEANEEEGSNVTLDRKRWVQQLEAEYSGGSGSGYHARQRAYSARGRAAEQVSRRCGCCAASGCELQRPCVELALTCRTRRWFSLWLGGTTPHPFACSRKP